MEEFFYWELELESKFSSNLVSQVSDLIKQQQANITHQEDILEGQILAQRRSEKSAQESQKELKEMIETLAHKLDEKSKKLMELHRQNLNLQEVLKEAANYSGMRERGVQRDNRSLSVNLNLSFEMSQGQYWCIDVCIIFHSSGSTLEVLYFCHPSSGE